MNCKALYAIAILVFIALLKRPVESKKVIIHVPYHVKNVKHTHTIYKIVPHYHEEKEDHDDEHHEGLDFYRK